MTYIKYNSTIILESKIKEYIDTKELFWYNDLIKDCNITDKDMYISYNYIKLLCSQNYIQPCSKKGNHTQYIVV